jgi:hypothetical protein
MSEVKNVTDSSVKKGRKIKKVKEGPVRAKSGYLMFCVENRPLVVSENPSITNTDIVTELAKRWQALKVAGGSDLQKYVDMATADKERYEKEMAEFVENKSQDEVVVVEAVVAEAPKKKGGAKKTKKEPEQPAPVVDPVPEEEVLEEEPDVVVEPKVEEKKKAVKGGGKGKKK